MDYFPHDTDASNDEKIEALRALYGNDGYAFYFILLERIYRTENAELDISKPAVLAALINKVHVTKERFDEMLETAFDIGCFNREAYEERRILTSNGIKRRAAEIQKMRERWRKRKASQENPVDKSEVFPEENGGDNPGEKTEETPESKEKKSKEKKSTSTTTTPLPPSFKEGESVAVVGVEAEKREVTEFMTNSFIIGASAFQVDMLTSWVDDGMKADAIIYAMEIALAANKREPRYVKGILKRWFDAGVRTRQQAEAYEAEHRRSDIRASPSDGGGSRVLSAEETRKYLRQLREAVNNG
ncbi:MAG TPA: DUF4373 domain-containing protein [Firmicutes bacterium]|nr:DUF4373 domain-containing protein [Bacillota bacterium]